ncbi:hypothetical protein [Blastococcus saxobsidens]|uniref:Uncharacterized protein n=1 Tax=Blastococcus saxobsidens (strain DD2) TaxID=1146883 RepID=H6RWE5_BLASD|nr:hypothetical protein [Blastococcus saxobsidens]CCG03360.1 conserved protein of unknown function [Blastococcus saxobsidens DD2]
MTEPSASRPVPGPYRPAPVPPPVPGRDAAPDPTPDVRPPAAAADSAPADPGDPERDAGSETPLADLGGLPVAEHVAVFETEHARLQRELGTIDRL